MKKKEIINNIISTPIWESDKFLYQELHRVARVEILSILKNIDTEDAQKEYIKYSICLYSGKAEIMISKTYHEFTVSDLLEKGPEGLLEQWYHKSLSFSYVTNNYNKVICRIVKRTFDLIPEATVLQTEIKCEKIVDEFLTTFNHYEWCEKQDARKWVGNIQVINITPDPVPVADSITDDQDCPSDDDYASDDIDDYQPMPKKYALSLKDIPNNYEFEDKVESDPDKYLVTRIYHPKAEMPYKRIEYYFEKIKGVDNYTLTYLFKNKILDVSNNIIKKTIEEKYKEHTFGVYKLDTYTDNLTQKLEVNAISLYSNKTGLLSYNLTDFTSVEDMFVEVWKRMKKSGLKLWFSHNGVERDHILILSIINNFKVKNLPIDWELMTTSITNSKVYKLKLRNLTNETIVISLKDSKILLKGDLKPLCKEYNIDEKEETKSLYEILSSFQKEIFDLYQIDILDKSTLTAAALTIWGNTVTGKKIARIDQDSKLYKDIQLAYYGGFSEVFEPHIEKGRMYDVRSLYPYIMKNFRMPTGTEIYWSDDKRLVNYNGFCLAQIKKENTTGLKTGVLPKRFSIKGKEDIITAPFGSWEGWYTSEELKFAVREGYQITVIEGYKFKEWDYIFEEYIDKTMKLKEESTGAKRQIAKLLLNALSGRFGLRKDEVTQEITKLDWESDKYVIPEGSNLLEKLKNSKESKKNFKIDISKIIEITRLGHNETSDYVLVKSSPKKNIWYQIANIAISATITSRARIRMVPYRMHPDAVMHDTDSIVLKEGSKFIEEIEQGHYFGKKLGDLGLDAKIEEAYFLKPKVYGYIEQGTKEPIIKSAGLPKGILKWEDLKFLVETKKEKEPQEIIKEVTELEADIEKLTVREVKREIRVTSEYNGKEKVYDKEGNWIFTRGTKIEE